MLDDPNRAFALALAEALVRVLFRARRANQSFQLHVTGYVEFWNEHDTQCNDYTWSSRNHPPETFAFLTTTLRADMNDLVRKLNAVLKETTDTLAPLVKDGLYYVDRWQSKFNGHRFCEHEDNPVYHQSPTDPKTWFIHWDSPFENPSSVTGIGPPGISFFDQVDSILIPPKDGKSTADQIKAVNGDTYKLNSAYNDTASMTAALRKLANDDPKYNIYPETWARVMHPKGSGYTVMSDAVIDNVLKYGATGAKQPTKLPAPAPAPAPVPKRENTCNSGNNRFMGRDDMNSQIGKFCADAAKQRVQDSGSGSIGRKYNVGSRYEVSLSIDWPPGLDITKDMEANCNNFMTQIVDGCDGNDPKNPLNWKHGGTFQVDQVKYNVIPEIDQNYTPGICTFHVQEDEKWSGVDGPGTERHFTFHLEKNTLKDGAGTVIATMGFARNGKDGVEIEAGDKNPLRFNSALPNPIVMTPEAGGKPKDYVQFSVGDQSWTTVQSTSMPYCNTGG